MTEHHDGYIIVGPFILSFGLVGALIKGALLVVAILAIPVGGALTIYSTYKPARALKEFGWEAWSRATKVVTSLAWLIFVIGIVCLFDASSAKYGICGVVLGILLHRIPFMLLTTAREHPHGLPQPLSPARLYLYRTYTGCMSMPACKLYVAGFLTFILVCSCLIMYRYFTNNAYLLSSLKATSLENTISSLGIFLAVACVFGALIAQAVFYPILLLLGLAEPGPSKPAR